MPAQSQIVITTKAPLTSGSLSSDFAIFDTSTPNDGTLDPDGPQANGMRKWSDKRSGVPAAYPYLLTGFREAQNASSVVKAHVRFVLPVMEEVSYDANGVKPGAKPAYSLQFVSDFLIPVRATALERQIFVSYLYSIMCERLIKSDRTGAVATGSPLIGMIRNLTQVW